MEHRGVSDVVYLYGFVPPGTDEPPADVGGVGGVPVRMIDFDRVRAAVAFLPAGIFGAETVESRLQDMAWVGEQGMAHERVVVWFADHADILPARLFSIYSGEPALRAAVSSGIDGIAHALKRLEGRREWNLKVAYDAAELARHGAEVSDELRSADAEIAAAPPGKRYLLERRRADMLKREVSRAARRLAEELLVELRALAEDALVLPLAAAEEGTAVVLNAALLTSRGQEDALKKRAQELYDRYTALGMIVTFSGPWAPYRFVEQYGNA